MSCKWICPKASTCNDAKTDFCYHAKEHEKSYTCKESMAFRCPSCIPIKKYMFFTFKRVAIATIIFLIAMCLFFAVTKCHADIPDTTIILCPEKTDTVTIDTVKTVKKGMKNDLPNL